MRCEKFEGHRVLPITTCFTRDFPRVPNIGYEGEMLCPGQCLNLGSGCGLRRQRCVITSTYGPYDLAHCVQFQEVNVRTKIRR